MKLTPKASANSGFPEETALSEKIFNARRQVNNILYTRRDMLSIAGLTLLAQGGPPPRRPGDFTRSQAHAALQGGHCQITDEDIVLAAELALPHRIKGRPFQDTTMSAFDLEEQLNDVQSEMGLGEEGEPGDEQEIGAAGKKALES
ncbi:MAG: hypothetical protein M5U34_15745 [Chloroflexi bacterium]|nr:hypothetical protein [Chloroflexota bacterium]